MNWIYKLKAFHKFCDNFSEKKLLQKVLLPSTVDIMAIAQINPLS